MEQMPGFEEYMSNALITSCTYLVFIALVPGATVSDDEKTVQWLLSEPKVVISAANVGRINDDLGSHEVSHM